MNLKCNIIFNIDIVNFSIIHVVIDFNENHNKSYGWITKYNDLIMEFSNDDIVFVT
jgi:hypothetical protein